MLNQFDNIPLANINCYLRELPRGPKIKTLRRAIFFFGDNKFRCILLQRVDCKPHANSILLQEIVAFLKMRCLPGCFLHQKPTIEMLCLFIDARHLIYLARVSTQVFSAIVSETSLATSVIARQCGRNLHVATYRNRLDVIQFLHENEAVFGPAKTTRFHPRRGNVPRTKPRTLSTSAQMAFACAARRGYFNILQWLFLHYREHCDIEIAINIAKQHGRCDMVEWLRSAENKPTK
jgi:hypothetical protein